MFDINDHGSSPALLFSKHLAASFGALILWASGITAPAALAQIPLHPAVPESLGVNIHFTDARPGEMEMLAGAGLGWVRADFIWGRMERERGQYDFSAYDRLMASLEKHKIRVLMILAGRNPLYDQGQFPYTDEGREALARWAVAAVQHFRGRNILWEMWNEPNVKRRDSPIPQLRSTPNWRWPLGRQSKKSLPWRPTLARRPH